MYPQGEDKGFQDFGTNSGFEWANSSFADNVQHSEVVTFSFLTFLRASQSFMDPSFSPIETTIMGSITVWGTDDVSSSVLCDQEPFKRTGFSLPPEKYWAKITVSLTFCAPKKFHNQNLTLIASLDINSAIGNLSMVVKSPSFRVHSSSSTSVSITRQPSILLSAGSIYDDAFSFKFSYGTDLDRVCQQGGIGRFKYSLILVCDGQVTNYRAQLPFNAGFLESTQCSQNVLGISFIRPARTCQFNISVLTDGIVFQLSRAFQVVPGPAQTAVLVGLGPFCASAGAIVWSVNSSTEGLCLVSQLQDSEGNNITSAVDATVVARSVHSSEPNYPVARSASNKSSASGLIRWCDAYSSKTQSAGVVFGVKFNEKITYWTSSVINVSAVGLASNLIPINSTKASNQTLMPGASPPKLSFSVEDAGGNSITSSTKVAIRVRIVPRPNATVGRSASLMPASARTGTRRLLQSSNFSTDACDRDTPLEFIFIQSSSTSAVAAGPEFLCRAGVNDIFFDVGTYVADSFSALVSNAFTFSITVSPGDFKYFCLLKLGEGFSAQSYSLIESLEIMFLDAGLNEVSGNASMSLVSINSSVFLYPANRFAVFSNASLRAFVPPFFLYVLNWMPSEFPFKITLAAANSTLIQYGTNLVTMYLNPSCSPGQFITPSSHRDLYIQLTFQNANKSMPFAGASSLVCAKCSNGTISNRFDAQTCRSVSLTVITAINVSYFADSCRAVHAKLELFRISGPQHARHAMSIIISLTMEKTFANLVPVILSHLLFGTRALHSTLSIPRLLLSLTNRSPQVASAFEMPLDLDPIHHFLS
jgi:hypothetical protein